MSQRRPVASVLLHPYLVIALAILVANDHWWKSRWPGPVTGKLSDFAGPVVVAFAIAAVTGRRRLAVTVTALGFTALKLSPTVAALAAPVLGGVTRTDPTDLVGLVALVPAWFLLGRAGIDPSRQPDPATTPTRRLPAPPSLTGRARTAALVVITPIMVFSVTATSCVETTPAFIGLFEVDDGVVAQLGDDLGEPFAYHLSADGGRTWTEVAVADLPGTGGGLDPSSIQAGDPIQETEVCLDDGRCFRAIEGSRIEVRDDADWVTSFEFTDEQVERMQARADGCSGTDRVDQFYASLVVTDAEGPADDADADTDADADADAAGEEVGGQTVIATMGPQGVIRLDPATGDWERIGVGTYEPISHFGPRWLLQLIFTPFVAIIASPLLLLINRRRSVSRNRRALAVILNIVGALSVFALAVVVVFFSFGSADYAWTGLGTLAVTILVFLVAVAMLLPAGVATPPASPSPHGRGHPGPSPPGPFPR